MSQKIKSLIEANSNKFSKNDRIIANYITIHSASVINLDIVSLSKEIYVSKSSITRFCIKIGLPGYKELKYLLNDVTDENSSDKIEFNTMIDFFQHDYIKIIEKIKMTVDDQTIKKVVEKINKAKRVFAVGVGSSGFSAHEFSYRLQRLGISSNSISDNHFILMNSKIATNDDLFIVFSQNGETKLLVEALENLNENNVTSILITQYNHSACSDLANEVVLVPQKQSLALTDSISNQLNLIIVSDIIIHYLFLSNPTHYKNVYDKTLIEHDKL